MNIEAQKLQLMKMLLETEDISLLAQVKDLFEAKKKADLWDEWDDEVRTDVEEAIAQADAGQLIPHSEAIKLLRSPSFPT